MIGKTERDERMKKRMTAVFLLIVLIFGNLTFPVDAASIKIKYNGKTLKNGTDYILFYSNNINTGKGNITIKGKGDYAYSLIDIDSVDSETVVEQINNIEGVLRVRVVK